jgi:hypothetical protein
MALLPGLDFDFGGGRCYLLPPLALGDLQLLQERLAKLSDDGALHPASVGTVLAATHAALRRNYPDLTLEAVGQLVDVGNLFEVIDAVMDVSGVKRKAAEQAAKNLLAQPETPLMAAPTGPD